MWVLLIVFQEHVIARLVLLDEIRFENERFDFRVRDDKLQIADPTHQLPRLAVMPAPRLKV